MPVHVATTLVPLAGSAGFEVSIRAPSCLELADDGLGHRVQALVVPAARVGVDQHLQQLERGLFVGLGTVEDLLVRFSIGRDGG